MMGFGRGVRRRVKVAAAGVAVALGVGVAAVAVSATSAAPPPATEQAAEYLKTHGVVVPPTSEPLPVIAVVGDSFAMDKPEAWPYRMAYCTNHRLVMSGVGGSGFWNDGKGKRYADPARIAKVTKDNPDIIILESAYNDSFRAETMAPTLEGYIVDTVEAYKKAAPKAKIVIVGPIWAIQKPTAGIVKNQAVLASAAKATGVPYINGIGWLPSTEYTGNDLKHPNAKGHIQITARIMAGFKAQKVTEATGGCENAG